MLKENVQTKVQQEMRMKMSARTLHIFYNMLDILDLLLKAMENHPEEFTRGGTRPKIGG